MHTLSVSGDWLIYSTKNTQSWSYGNVRVVCNFGEVEDENHVVLHVHLPRSETIRKKNSKFSCINEHVQDLTDRDKVIVVQLYCKKSSGDHSSYIVVIIQYICPT